MVRPLFVHLIKRLLTILSPGISFKSKQFSMSLKNQYDLFRGNRPGCSLHPRSAVFFGSAILKSEFCYR